MLSNLVGFFRGKLHKRRMREYELDEPNGMMTMRGTNGIGGNLHKTKSSLRSHILIFKQIEAQFVAFYDNELRMNLDVFVIKLKC
jgi:hypothetical protein